MPDESMAIGGAGGPRSFNVSVKDAAEMLSRAGRKTVTVEMIQSDIAAGAPVNPDGTINLLGYTAWLAREVTHAP